MRFKPLSLIRMNLKHIFIIIILLIVIIGGFYYTMSPYQNCIRDIDKRIEEVRNKLATETDLKKRDELEIKNKDLINQRESECSERSDW